MGIKEYYSHDNGGRPFRVLVEENHVTIYQYLSKEQNYDGKPILTFDCQKIFVGKHIPTPFDKVYILQYYLIMNRE